MLIPLQKIVLFFKQRPITIWYGAIAFILILASTAKIYHLTKTYGGAELKRRIVGARLLSTDKQPYHYNWQGDADEKLFVSNSGQPQNLNGLSVPPSVLYVLKPLSNLAYNKIRVIWNVLQLLAFFSIVILVFKTSKFSLFQKKIGLLAALIIYCSATWHMNIERGQIYIFYALIMALMHYWYIKNTLWSNICFGVLLALATWLRPFFGVIFVPLVFNNKHTAIISTICTSIIFMAITYLDWPIWQQYFKAMQMYVTYNLTDDDPAKVIFTGAAEGLTNYDKAKADWNAGGLTPFGYLIFNKYHIAIPTIVYNVFVMVSVLMASWFFKNIRPQFFMLLAFLCYLMFELIMPAQRGSYNLIQWLLPILILLTIKKQSTLHLLLLIIGFCFIQGWPFYFPALSSLGEILLIAVLFLNLKEEAEYNTENELSNKIAIPNGL